MGTENFDKWQFADRRTYAVNGRSEAGQIVTSGLSFSDYERMHTVTRAPVFQRVVPSWATDDRQLRELILLACENKLRILESSEGLTHAQRLQRIRERAAVVKSKKSPVLTAMCKQYVALKTGCATVDQLRRMEVKIEGLDCELVNLQRAPELMAACTFRYYRLRENSVQISEALRTLKPPAVRQILFRLRKLAELGHVRQHSRGAGRPRKEPLPPPQKEKRCVLCGAIFYTSLRNTHRRFCTKRCRVVHNTRQRAERRRARALLCPRCKEAKRKATYQFTHQFTNS